MLPADMMATAKDLVTPVYMPRSLRVAAIVVGLLILLPPLIHMAAHIYLALVHPDVAERLHQTSDWPRFAQIVFGAGVGFPDPVVSMIRAWRAKGDST